MSGSEVQDKKLNGGGGGGVIVLVKAIRNPKRQTGISIHWRAPRFAHFFMFAFIISMALCSKKRSKLNW